MPQCKHKKGIINMNDHRKEKVKIAKRGGRACVLKVKVL